ncbi:SGNH/GDSL hydrolase family protein [Bacillus sp. FJAT-49732]|uniref:SGNH/GDSL hydrolase family protein n=1 Tax=Lederbergia citrisecunda TaxID=2833583 RepID=A0A942TL35_9BACI|nr:SGNH/GDSL hydrolase family protein [Lederbergia citrisecunda]MBS4199433.1 SGNH/GDSL hydrolase family protein [Lederbergia citrisecunda]
MIRKYFSIAIGCILFLTGCSAPYTTQGIHNINREEKQLPPADFMPLSIKIVSIGDSLTQGIGDIEGKGGYIPYLKSKLESNRSIKDAQFSNFGVKGNRTDQLMKRLSQDEIKNSIKDADIVIITIGGNDVMQVFKENIMGLHVKMFLDAEKGYDERLTDIIDKVISYNTDTEIFLVGIYNPFIRWFSDLKEMDEIVKSWNQSSSSVISEYYQTTFVPIDDIFHNQEESLLYTDYFHPNNEGYKLIAERIYDYLGNKGKLEKQLK